MHAAITYLERTICYTLLLLGPSGQQVCCRSLPNCLKAFHQADLKIVSWRVLSVHTTYTALSGVHSWA